MTRVLLVRPLCAGDEPEFAEPLGIERLAGYLRAHGVRDVGVFDRRLYQRERRTGRDAGSFWRDVRAAFGTRPPDVVGVSLMTDADVPDALRVMSRMRAWWPEATFQAGGLYVTTSPKEARLRLPSHTVLQCGEGERGLLMLAFSMSRQHGGARAPFDHAPQALLTPDEWAPAYRPALERYAALGCAVNIQTSRGCPGTCAFCATPSLVDPRQRWVPREIGLVADEMQHEAERLTRAGLPPVFNFVDDDFGPLTRVELLAGELERRGMRVAYSLEMRLASLIGAPHLEERLARLREGGLTRVFFGVESLDEHTLRRWKKPYDVAALPEVLTSFAAAGVAVQPGYILWHASQTVVGALREVRALRRLGIYSHRAALSRLIVFPGCELGTEAVGAGFEACGEAEERLYSRLSELSGDLTRRWTQAAIVEPRAQALAHLTGDDSDLQSVRAELGRSNDASYELFCALAEASLGA